MAKLKLFNGRCYCVLPTEKWKDDKDREAYIFAAAHSIADLRRLFVECGMNDPGGYEIDVFFNKGAWGNCMQGVQVERGVWVQYGAGNTPVRVPQVNQVKP